MHVRGLVLAGAVLAAPQQDTSAVSLRWLVPTAEISRDAAMPAWLHVSVRSPTDTVRIELVGPDATPHRFGLCSDSAEPSVRWEGSVIRDTLLATCFRRSARTPFRLLAAARFATAPDSAAGIVTSGSELIDVTPSAFWPPGPMAMAIIAAVLGFTGGLATQLTTSAIKTMNEARATRLAAQKQAIAHLLPEMRANRRRLDAYLSDPTNQSPPDLGRTEFEKLAQAGDLGRLLAVGRLAPSLRAVHEAYKGPMAKYDRDKSQQRDATEAARGVVDALDRFTSGENP